MIRKQTQLKNESNGKFVSLTSLSPHRSPTVARVFFKAHRFIKIILVRLRSPVTQRIETTSFCVPVTCHRFISFSRVHYSGTRLFYRRHAVCLPRTVCHARVSTLNGKNFNQLNLIAFFPFCSSYQIYFPFACTTTKAIFNWITGPGLHICKYQGTFCVRLYKHSFLCFS